MTYLELYYTLNDIFIMFLLFAAILTTVGTFILLMCHLIKGVFEEVEHIKKDRAIINTQ